VGDYFVTGKFFQGADVQEPHSAIVAAFSDVCDLIAQSDDFDEIRRREIQLALASDGQLLKRFISNLAPFLGSEPPIGHKLQNHETIDVFMESTLAQFKLACKTFLRAMASREHPLVIVIDDIQWMDEGSKLLIEMFLHDADLKYVMLILCYRDEERDSVVDLLDRCDERLVNISLQSLDVSCGASDGDGTLGIKLTRNSCSQRSGCQTVEWKSFSCTVIHRNNSEEWFTGERSPGIEPWVFDVHKIQEEVMVCGTTADLLARKLLNVSTEIQETLKLASLIGYSFDSSLLITVACRLKTETQDCHNRDHETLDKEIVLKSLDNAVMEGFLEGTQRGYQFTHDKIQFAFQSMIKSEHEKQHLHLSHW
jgi:predicted ATPase